MSNVFQNTELKSTFTRVELNNTPCSKITIRVTNVDEKSQKCGSHRCTGINKIEFNTGMVEVKQADCPANDAKEDEIDLSMLFFEEPTNIANYEKNKRSFKDK